MEMLLAPLQAGPLVGGPELLTTLVVVIVALLLVRFMLGLAIKVAFVVAVLLGILWLFGAIPFLSL